MAMVVLRGTNNPKYQYLIGTVGGLSFSLGKFNFRFPVKGMSTPQVLSSYVVSSLGDLRHPSCRGVWVNTNNSMYHFEKLENTESLYGWVR